MICVLRFASFRVLLFAQIRSRNCIYLSRLLVFVSIALASEMGAAALAAALHVNLHLTNYHGPGGNLPELSVRQENAKHNASQRSGHNEL